MSNENSSDKGKGKNSVSDPVNPQNLALLYKRDRTAIMGIGLIMSMAGITVITLGSKDSVGTLVFAGATVLVVIGLLVLVYLRGSTHSGLETRLNTENAAARAVNGHWWQIVHTRTRDHPGLSYVAIGISSVAERSAMVGRTYNSEGSVVATFSSDAVAIRSTSPIEIFYMWAGTLMDSTETQLVFGIGRFRFDSVGNEDRPLFGGGMFTRGSKHQMTFGTAWPVELRRFTKEEEDALIENPDLLDELAIKAYDRFKLPKGVGLLEG